MTQVILSMQSNLIDALTNTLLGMGTVFLALILISFIISLLKPISDFFTGAHKTKPTPVAHLDNKPNVVEEVDVDNETELVAVITAAIMASYESSNYTPDGLVVRRIRRINK